ANRLREATDALLQLVWGCRADGYCDYVNGRWVEYTGFPETSLHGYGWLDQVHADDRDRVRKEWRKSLEESSPFGVELRIRAAGGAYRWFRACATPVRDARGLVTKWYGAAVDIDDLRRAQEETSQRLEQLHVVAENTREALLLLNADQTIAFFNEAAERLF